MFKLWEKIKGEKMKNLGDLLDVLDELGLIAREIQRDGFEHEPWEHDAYEKFEKLRDKNNIKSLGGLDLDFSSLPIFSENEMKNTAGVLSYDDEDMIVEGVSEFEIVPRNDL